LKRKEFTQPEVGQKSKEEKVEKIEEKVEGE